MSHRKIVVLTPVRNEDWILDVFLKVTSEFADLIIIADQGSTDRSLSICRTFEKVHVLSNPDQKYDEASRQRHLIKAARELVPGERILLALDTDEILAANALSTNDWQRMLTAAPGTVLIFEKPNLYRTHDSCIRYGINFPGGYVDDGAEHRGTKIHSIRIPVSDAAPRLTLGDIKFLHYALLRLGRQAAKLRMYSVIENIARTKSAFQRRRYYDSKTDWAKQGRTETTDPEWFCGWELRGIDVTSIQEQDYYWQDLETLKHLVKYGSLRFWLDDIWEFDWRTFAANETPTTRIIPPPVFLRNLLRVLVNGLSALGRLRRRLSS